MIKMRYIRLTILLVITIICCLFAVWWLAGLTAVTAIIYAMFAFNSSVALFILKRKALSTSLAFLAVVLLAVCVKLFFVKLYHIPSDSMQPTLIPGDKIVVNKLSYGPLLPKSPFEIPLVNIAMYFNKKARERAGENWWGNARLKGFSAPQRGDVMVFIAPIKSRENFVKRCAALPGDTLQVEGGIVKVNGNAILNNKLQLNSIVYSRTDDLLVSDNYLVKQQGKSNGEQSTYHGIVTSAEKERWLGAGLADSVLINAIEPDTLKKCFPRSPLFNWSIDYFGPLVIPQAGMTIELNDSTFALYRKAINQLDGANISKNENGFLINGQAADSYTFNNNFYFMLGDNRHYSGDSRMWGFVPEYSIIGKANLVLWSFYGKSFNNGRVFKPVK
jgi:signal peptidase I